MVIIISVVTVFVVMFTIAVVLMIIGRKRGTLFVLYMTVYGIVSAKMDLARTFYNISSTRNRNVTLALKCTCMNMYDN